MFYLCLGNIATASANKLLGVEVFTHFNIASSFATIISL